MWYTFYFRSIALVLLASLWSMRKYFTNNNVLLTTNKPEKSPMIACLQLQIASLKFYRFKRIETSPDSACSLLVIFSRFYPKIIVFYLRNIAIMYTTRMLHDIQCKPHLTNLYEQPLIGRTRYNSSRVFFLS